MCRDAMGVSIGADETILVEGRWRTLQLEPDLAVQARRAQVVVARRAAATATRGPVPKLTIRVRMQGDRRDANN